MKKIIFVVFILALVVFISGCKTEECIGEGDSIAVIANPPECCNGLTLIPPKDAEIVGSSGYCTANCGNGVCDSEIESNYNCPDDCHPVQDFMP